MSDDFRKDNIRSLAKAEEQSGNIFIDEYIIVPDSVSGITKILFVEVFPVIQNISVVNSKTSVAGELHYSVVYIADDPFEAVKVVVGSVDFSNILDLNTSGTHETFIESWMRIDKTEYSLVNPHKISLNAVLKACVIFCEERQINCLGDITENENAETLYHEQDILNFDSINKHEITLCGGFEVASEKSEIDEIVLANVLSCENSIMQEDEALNIDAKVKARCGYIDSQKRLRFEEFEFDVSEKIAIEDIPKNAKIISRLRLKDITTRVHEDDDGERRRIKFDAKFDVVIEIYEVKKLSIIKDFYVVKSPVKMKHTSFPITKNLNSISRKIKVKTGFDGVEGYDELYVCSSDVHYVVNKDDDGIGVVGGIRLKGILFSDKEQERTREVFMQIPIDEKLIVENAAGESVGVVRANISLDDLFISSAGKDRVECDVEISLKLDCHIEEKVEIVEEIEIGHEIQEEDGEYSRIRLYYSREKDNLWKIGKKFGVKRREVIELNPEANFDNLPMGEMIILP